MAGLYFVVTSTSDDINDTGSLRYALSQAGDNDTIVFNLPAGIQTIQLTSTLNVTHGVLIDGGSGNIVISGTEKTNPAGGRNLGFPDFTFAGTSPQPAIIKNLAINNGSAKGAKGAFGTPPSPQSNGIGGPGGPGGDAAGGIFVSSGALALVNDTFANDVGTGGIGGPGAMGVYPDGSGDGADGAGGNAAGAVYVEPGATVVASGLSFTGNIGNAGPGFAGAKNGQGYNNSNDPAVVCFASGTLIRTVRGRELIDFPVETLRIGDLVITASGPARPIRWLGHRTIDCSSHPRPHEAHPIRIAARAFGENRPARDLFVSPGHSICVDACGEVLIPAAALVNGTSIVQVTVDHVTYWHVELDSHDILLAENLPAESYLEMGNRGFFAEAAVVALAAMPDAKVPTHADFCRPFHADGPLVEAVRARLAAKTEQVTRRARAA